MGLFVFTFVMLTNAIIKLMDLLITKGVEPGRILWLFLLSLPHLLVLTIPMSVLLAVLVSFGRLSHDSEITAMKACGVSLFQLMKPVLLFSLIACLGALAIFIYALPSTNSQLRQLRFDILRSRSNIAIKPNVFNDDFDDLVIYVDAVERETGAMKDVFISSQLNKEEPEVIIAKRAVKIPIPGQEKVILRLENGFIHSIPNNNPTKYSINPFQVYDISLDMMILQGTTLTKGDRELTIRELLTKAQTRKDQGRNPNPQIVEVHKKFSIPFACLVFGLIGVPLGITSRRSGKSVGFAISIGLFIVYYIFLAGGEGLGDEGKVPPWAAMWTPNILLGGIGLYLLIKMNYESPFKVLNVLIERLKNLTAVIVRPFKAARQVTARSRTARPHALRRFHHYRVVRILDRYVGMEFFRLFLLILTALIALSFIVHLFEKIDDLVELNATLVSGFLAIFFRVPFFTSLAIHFAVLSATLLTIGKMSRNSEIVAMMANGISYPRLTAPIIMLSMLISVGAYLFSEHVIPACTKQAEQQWNTIRKRETIPFIYNRRWFRGENNSIFFFQSYDSTKREMHGFSYFQFDAHGLLRQRVETNRVVWHNKKWHYLAARMLSFDERGELVDDHVVANYESEIREKPDNFTRDYKESEEMNRKELRVYTEQLRKLGFDSTEYLVDLHTKLSIPFLSIVMAVIGIPFAYHSSRSGGLVGVGVSLFIGALFFLVFQVGVGLGHGGKLPPLLGAWIANFLFFCAGIYLLLTRHR